MKVSATLTVLLALLLLPTGANAAANRHRASQLDRSFGRNGKVVVPRRRIAYLAPHFAFQMLPAPGGKTVVAIDDSIYRLRSDGRLDPSFGGDGRITVRKPEGLVFDPAEIAVDQQGRVLVAGTSRRVDAEPDPVKAGSGTLVGPLPSWATVMRFLSDGEPDREFGTAGRFDSTLSLPPPEPFQYYEEGSYRPVPFENPAVRVHALAVDEHDRPLIAGSSVTKVGWCYLNSIHRFTASFVTRLTERGAVDAEFASAPIPEGERGEAIVATPGGSWLLEGGSVPTCPRAALVTSRLYGLTESGATDPAFGSGGGLTIPFVEPPALAADRWGRVLLVGAGRKEPPGEQTPRLVARLGPNGSSDAGFGEAGYFALDLPRSGELLDVAVDGRGRPLLAGWELRREKHPGRQFLLARLTVGGRIDRGFGGGLVRTRFGKRSNARAEGVFRDARGRIVVGGRVNAPRFPNDEGFAVARYLSGGR